MADLLTTYLGLRLKNPLIAGSCGLTNSVHNIREIADRGVGAVVVKSVFEEQINLETHKVIRTEEGNLKTFTRAPSNLLGRRVHDYDEAYDYIYDFAKSNTVNKYLDLLKEVKKSVDIPVIASINCVSNNDWHSFARKIEETGVDALELNIYVLPSDWRRNTEDNEKIYFDILNEVKTYVNIPLSVKIGFYFSSLAQAVQKLSNSGIKGIVLFNRPYNTDFDIDRLEVSHGSIYSGPSEYNHTLRWVSILSGNVGCDISASTGIHNWEAFVKQLLAGAATVQIASALYTEGFGIVPSILEETKAWMKKHSFEKVDDFRGKLSKSKLENPAAIERVQFMKLYSGIE
ncbi:MAG TPA: dihydroorotate dehydrogenase-like protein [Bacteroidales bacterium]|nr:dihydroorotate dehydrogenase-like protein [Bacteroidales bacterium]